MPRPRIGSLFSGAGGLDLAVEHVTSGCTVWHSEVDPDASKVLETRWPGVPNLGDITAVDWAYVAEVAPIEVLCGGFPCQDVSAAGRRAGIAVGTRSGLWLEYAEAINQLRPQLVVIENVRGLLSGYAHRAMEPGTDDLGGRSGRPLLRAAGAVFGDLADLGYDAQWTTVAASGVGAPHRRDRVFIVAYPTGQPWRLDQRCASAHPAGDRRDEGWSESAGFVGRPNAALGSDADGRATLLPTLIADLLPTPAASDATGGGQTPDRREGHSRQLIDYALLNGTPQWGKYAPAIHRWETITRSAPSPTEPGAKGNPRLAAPFSEWMIGYPLGWITDVAISRSAMLRIIGNSVCPQQAIAALQWLFNIEAVAA
ncbi:DNA (cytosine-5-)-methyltransferase [Mycobacteroides chelonae]|uniref:DNA (cytosine-5-)-methyltransferase n=1 Tax=Mycobacteroides chelonae TaxID=1774 RepID=A0A1S1LMD8_MYCCH|nr:DNA cytosine methyltransferase [Mycobacteroides chelonae]OHU51465.1 DNA (cytosine-5-)-methyltransferase [Mycobacteroides chelonae]